MPNLFLAFTTPPASGLTKGFILANNVRRKIRFASFSAVNACVVTVRAGVPGSLQIVDRLNLSGGTPHSWWGHSGQPLVPDEFLGPGMEVSITTTVAGDMRVDYDDEIIPGV